MKLRKVWKLLRERHAMNVVISNVILTGAVIAVGFVVLAWTQYRSSAYNKQYNEAMNANIARLKESLAFEYVFYDSDESELWAYLMNCGTIDEVAIQTVYVKNNTWFGTYTRSEIALKFLNETLAQSLNMSEEGILVLSSVGLVTGKSYSMRIVTERGSAFEYLFVA